MPLLSPLPGLPVLKYIPLLATFHENVVVQYPTEGTKASQRSKAVKKEGMGGNETNAEEMKK